VSNYNIALRYQIAPIGERMSAVATEVTGYQFPKSATTFLSPMMSPMKGFHAPHQATKAV
jgi:hypothetical protein